MAKLSKTGGTRRPYWLGDEDSDDSGCLDLVSTSCAPTPEDKPTSLSNLNDDPQRPYDLFNFYYPPGQTSVLYH